MPKPNKNPIPCFVAAHANYWADAMCTKFTTAHRTYMKPIHKHCPSIPYPSPRYTLTIGPDAIKSNTPNTIADRYHEHILIGFGRRLVAG